jgi:hypothetical protein
VTVPSYTTQCTLSDKWLVEGPLDEPMCTPAYSSAKQIVSTANIPPRTPSHRKTSFPVSAQPVKYYSSQGIFLARPALFQKLNIKNYTSADRTHECRRQVASALASRVSLGPCVRPSEYSQASSRCSATHLDVLPLSGGWIRLRRLVGLIGSSKHSFGVTLHAVCWAFHVMPLRATIMY